MNDFQQTVNLKDKMKRPVQEPAFTAVKAAPKTRPARRFERLPEKKADSIDEVYSNENNNNENLKQFKRPIFSETKTALYRNIIVLLFVAVAFTFVYFTLIRRAPATPADGTAAAAAADQAKWYNVKLLNGEAYYGQIKDTSSDPVVITNVYYNYEQLSGADEPDPTGSLKLVKRGKEAHGPDGTMDIVRAQVVYMEPLKDDSKVLQAILEYEK